MLSMEKTIIRSFPNQYVKKVKHNLFLVGDTKVYGLSSKEYKRGTKLDSYYYWYSAGSYLLDQTEYLCLFAKDINRSFTIPKTYCVKNDLYQGNKHGRFFIEIIPNESYTEFKLKGKDVSIDITDKQHLI